MKFEKTVTFRPAYDKRHPNPSKNYGIHGVEILFLLKGKKGAVQFLISTSWQLPHVQKEMDALPLGQFPYLHHKPMPADLGYHSYKPMYEEHLPSTNSCSFLDNKPCYYDGSALNAEPIFNVLLKEGSDGVWRELEQYYNEVFEVREVKGASPHEV